MKIEVYFKGAKINSHEIELPEPDEWLSFEDRVAQREYMIEWAMFEFKKTKMDMYDRKSIHIQLAVVFESKMNVGELVENTL